MRHSSFALTPFLFFFAANVAQALPHWKGEQRALVLLLEWDDQPRATTREQMAETFFGVESRSLRDFFIESSQGKFDLTGEVRDWARTATRWDPKDGCDLSPIVREALAVHTDIATSDYDSDRNGKIDNLFVVHSGRIPWDRVGPECTFTTSSRADHTIVFQAGGIGTVGTAIPVGFYIHEAGHGYFDLPDLYADHYHGRYGIGMWGMMGLGAWGVANDISREDMFRYPSHFEPMSKVIIGWATPRELVVTTRNVVLRPVETTGDLVSIPTASGRTYYLEYRSNHGFSVGHKGHGLLIWNDFELIQADGRDDLNHGNDLGYRPLPPIAENLGDDSDPFPGSLGVTSYENTDDGVRFENIRITDAGVELDVVIDPNVPRVRVRPLLAPFHTPASDHL